MKKFLLVGINASYSHTCLAVRSIAAYTGCDFAEFTINQPYSEILRGIVKDEPQVIMFATYIWNAELVCKLIPDLKTLLPESIIGAGGPEFGYAPSLYLTRLPALTFIVLGEGEQTVNDLVSRDPSSLKVSLKDIPGLCYRAEETKSESADEAGNREAKLTTPTPATTPEAKSSSANLLTTPPRPLLCNLDELKFPYTEFPENKIFYYESSRGCPYSCSYCLSSVDKRVRFLSLERVYKDLQIFLDAGVRLVKFVDRTFNLKPERYLAIWRYIIEHHNGKTMFHFEIEAENMTGEVLDFLQTVPKGVMQFEIGVQSANKKTLQTINRSDNIEKLAANIKRIPNTIHKHLDLIAGLPYEDLESFGHSFDFVMDLNPDALQLGFLKILHGTEMERYASANNWKWSESPVYETFSTPHMSYKDILFLKDVEVVTDALINSGTFIHFTNYASRIFGWWNFISSFTRYAQTKGAFDAARRDTYWFELISQLLTNTVNKAELEKYGFTLQNKLTTTTEAVSTSDNTTNWVSILQDLLRYDFVLRGKQGGFPKWYNHRYNKDRHRELLEQNGGITNARLDFAHSEYEVFDCNVDSSSPEKNPVTYEKLIRYSI